MQAAKAFGVAFQVDEQTYANLQNHGIDLKETSGESHHMLPVPAVFLINTSGTITFRYYNPDYRERISTEMLLKAAQDTE